MEQKSFIEKIRMWMTPEVISAVSGVVIAFLGLLAAVNAAQAAAAEAEVKRLKKPLDNDQKT